MHEQVAGFAKVAEEYERGRPGYPPEIVAWILAMAGLKPGSDVVDLAAGTGKFTRLLYDAGLSVTAVEPIAAMRARLESALPQVKVREGTAESSGLQSESTDLVTAAQAFHWFANDQALAEIARLLRPGGHLALVWNQRDSAQPLQRELTEMMAPYRQDTPSHETGAWVSAMAETPLFADVGEHSIEVQQDLTRKGLVDRVVSTSFIATLPQVERAAVAEAVASLVAGDTEVVRLAYVCRAFLYRKEAA